MLEKITTKNKVSGTPGIIFNLDENNIHINNKPDSIITENVSKNNVLTSGEKSGYAGQFLFPILLLRTSTRNRNSVLAYPQDQMCT